MSEAVKRYCMRAAGSIVQPIEVHYSGTWVPAADHDRIVSALTEAGVKMQAEVEQLDGLTHNLIGECERLTAERDQLAERCRELEESVRGHGSEIDRLLVCGIEDAYTINTLRAEVERLTALQLPPEHLPMPRRMLELLIGDPQDPYRANAESVASEMLSGALPDPESHEKEFSALRNVRLLLAEIDRLRKVEERLSWMIKEGCWMHTGRKRDGELFYYLEWPDFMENQSDAFGDPMESIDAAMEASR